MQEPINKYCKVGVVSFMLFKDGLHGKGNYDQLNFILEDPFFEALEMTWIKDAEVRRQVAAKIKSAGKTVGFGAQPVQLTQQLDINSLDESIREQAVKTLIAVIPQAYELGAEGFAVLSGKNVPGEKKEQAIQQLLKSLREVSGALQKEGDIPLILETFDNVDYGKNALIGPSVDAARVAEEMRKDYSSFGLLLDLSHLPLLRETPEQAIGTTKKFLVHTHMGNCIMEKPNHSMNGDEHPPIADPEGMNGVEELSEYIRCLLEVGYLNKETRPILSFEVCAYKDWTQKTLLDQSKKILQQAWAQV